MEARAKWLVITGLLAAGDCLASNEFTLRQHGVSIPLHKLAPDTRAQHNADAAPPPGPRTTGHQVADAPRKLRQALAPLHSLPLAAAAPPLPHVTTNGSRIVADGPNASHSAGAAGATQFVQLAGGRMSVYGKYDGGLEVGATGANRMFADGASDAGMKACAERAGAGAVRYDQLANRWIVTFQAGTAHQCIAVSVSPDAAGRYYRYVLRFDAPFDDPKMALWPDAYYFSFKLFDSGGQRYLGPRICGIDRHAMLRGAHAITRCREVGAAYGPLSPASMEGYAQPPHAPAPALFLALEPRAQGRGERLVMWRFSFSRNTLGEPLAIPVEPFTIACAHSADGACIAQPPPGRALGALGDRLMPGIVYRHQEGRESLVLNHAVAQPGGQVGVRWYEIGDPFGAVQVVQQGTHGPDSASRWMASAGIDKAGNIALGYAIAGADTAPGIRYTGRQRHDAPGRMQQEEIIVNGSGSHLGDAAWLPGGALSLDPIDGCTFWYTQQYVPATGHATWRSRIASFKFLSCL